LYARQEKLPVYTEHFGWPPLAPHEHGVEKMQNEVEAFAELQSVPVVCGSDSHHPIHIGAVKNVFNYECHTAK